MRPSYSPVSTRPSTRRIEIWLRSSCRFSAAPWVAMQADAGFALREMRVDGGASVNDLLLQFQADVIGVPVIRPAITETTALGAAYLAGLAARFWQSEVEIAAQWRAEKIRPVLSKTATSASNTAFA